MDRDKIGYLLAEAKRCINHREYVIIGSLSVLGRLAYPPDEMIHSIDVDLFPRLDPSRASEVASCLGLDSDFARKYGYYADAVSPVLPSLPEHWEERLLRIDFPDGIVAWFLEPHDAAISKYARGEPRDRDWIKSGLKHGILNIDTISARMRETIMEEDEYIRAAQAIEEDKGALDSLMEEDQSPGMSL